MLIQRFALIAKGSYSAVRYAPAADRENLRATAGWLPDAGGRLGQVHFIAAEQGIAVII
jgi:hypothetical protein